MSTELDEKEVLRIEKIHRQLLENCVNADPNLSLFNDDKYRAKAYKNHVWSNTTLKLGILVIGFLSGLTVVTNGIRMWLGI